MHLAVPLFHGLFGCSSNFWRSFQGLRAGGLGKGQEHGWGIACCIVMCHRLKQSRIATKRFGSQSPMPSFQTHCKTMEAEVLSSANQPISAGGQEDNGRRCARRDATAPTTSSHTVFVNFIRESPVFSTGTPITARLNSK